MRSFDNYWQTEGSRQQVESHEERARRAWDACMKAAKIDECDFEIVPNGANWTLIEYGDIDVTPKRFR